MRLPRLRQRPVPQPEVNEKHGQRSVRFMRGAGQVLGTSAEGSRGMRIAFIALLFLAGQADAQPGSPCKPRVELIYKLANEHLEAPIFRGLDGTGQMIEVFANPKTGTWTITRTAPVEVAKMRSCVMSVGQAAEAIAYDIGEPS
jgi:hypothetical protein